MDILKIEYKRYSARSFHRATKGAPRLDDFCPTSASKKSPSKRDTSAILDREKEFTMQKEKRIKRKNRAGKSISSVSNDIDLGRCATLSGLLFPRLPFSLLFPLRVFRFCSPRFFHWLLFFLLLYFFFVCDLQDAIWAYRKQCSTDKLNKISCISVHHLYLKLVPNFTRAYIRLSCELGDGN